MGLDIDDLRAAEARDLLDINQRRRGRAEATLVLIIVLTTALVAAAFWSNRKAVVLPLPAGSLLLLALSFQQFADVSVLGAGRRKLEDLVNETVGGPALIYESAIAPIRQRSPLVRSVRMLQSLVVVLTLAGLASATSIAFERPAAVWAPYVLTTALALVVTCLSYRDMLRSGRVGTEALEHFLGSPPPAPSQR